MKNSRMQSPARRKFLLTAPVATVAGLVLSEAAYLPFAAIAQATTAATQNNFKLISAAELAGDIKAQQVKPGGAPLYSDKNLGMNIATEKANAGKEFEWHETRDHVVHIIEGSTLYELGGTPQGAHSPSATQWLAPTSAGASSVTLQKGDILVIPRGTPHKRTTADSVTILLITPVGA